MSRQEIHDFINRAIIDQPIDVHTVLDKYMDEHNSENLTCDGSGVYDNGVPIGWHVKTIEELNIDDWIHHVPQFLVKYDDSYGSNKIPIIAIGIDCTDDTILIIFPEDKRGIEYTLMRNDEGISVWKLSKIILYSTCYSENSITYDIVDAKVVKSVETYKVNRRRIITYIDNIITSYEYTQRRFGTDPVIGQRIEIIDAIIVECDNIDKLVNSYINEIVHIEELSEDSSD